MNAQVDHSQTAREVLFARMEDLSQSQVLEMFAKKKTNNAVNMRPSMTKYACALRKSNVNSSAYPQ